MERNEMLKNLGELLSMGQMDRFYDDQVDLPLEAGEDTARGFEPNEEWLEDAEPQLQNAAMKAWFLSRYWDPANDTPYSSDAGGYIYIHGGPYDAREELEAKFGHLVSEEIIEKSAEDLESEGIYEWAPIHTEPDYDLAFELEISARENPYQGLTERISEVASLAKQDLDEPKAKLLFQLLYSHLISALEAYLAETMSYWVDSEQKVFRRFVQGYKPFQDRKVRISEIFDSLESLKGDVEKQINLLVWHRLDSVMPLFCESLEIERPKIAELMKHVLVRHDIVHRGGKTRDGDIVNVAAEQLTELQKLIMEFSDKIEKSLSQRYPETAP